ncbi:MAG: hypothetical protein WCB27_24575 [Thermoguttaceae bacterium]
MHRAFPLFQCDYRREPSRGLYSKHRPSVLRGGSIDHVKRATEQAISAGKPGGGFILQPVDFLEYGTPIENVEAYVSTALQHAAY